jgi:DNA mismatch repair protein MutL
MSRIRLLASAIIDRIAAGEVVERPASVVKELIENSLDAGATRVHVRVESGGRQLIEVADDGHGIDEADAHLAFIQHATSKVDTLEDLDRIATLGFRGEALASIAAISRVDMVTGTGEGTATRVRVEGAGSARIEVAAAPRGTRIQVRDLFYNTPARRKHLRTDATEMQRVASAVQEFALLRPDVHFLLVGDGRERLVAPPVADLRGRVHQVLGAEVAEAWIPLLHEGSRVTVRGGITDPLYSRANRNDIHLFVNGRAIADARLRHAVVVAFDTLLERGRAPVAAVFLEMPMEDVDVNVHPRKAEVRFVEPGRVFGTLRRAVAEALARHTVPPPLRPSDARGAIGVSPPAVPGAMSAETSGARAGAGDIVTVREPTLPMRDWVTTPGAARPQPEVDSGGAIPGTFGAIQPLAQYANTYILAADDEGLLIIDQHVAHERILYERILADRRGAALPVQRLLVPETIDLSAAEAEIAEEHRELLASFGFELDPFGGSTWAIRTTPELLSSRRAEPTLRALLGKLADEAGEAAGEQAMREIAASLACHSAVRANQPLSLEVMGHLVGELTACEAPNRCPHGRPVLVRVEHGALEKQLKRH